MEAMFINKQYDGKFYTYDLVFFDEVEQLLRLTGVTFETEPIGEDFNNRATEIAEWNLFEYELTKINF